MFRSMSIPLEFSRLDLSKIKRYFNFISLNTSLENFDYTLAK